MNCYHIHEFESCVELFTTCAESAIRTYMEFTAWSVFSDDVAMITWDYNEREETPYRVTYEYPDGLLTFNRINAQVYRADWKKF